MAIAPKGPATSIVSTTTVLVQPPVRDSTVSETGNEPADVYMVVGDASVEVSPFPKSQKIELGSTLLLEVLVNVTTVGGLKQEATFGFPDPSATTSKTSISVVVLSVHPKLSVTVKFIV